MKKLTSIALALMVSSAAIAQAEYIPTEENLASRKEFADSKLGIFIHWGPSSIFGQGEWYLYNGKLNFQEYKKAADAFYPHRFNAQKWVAAIKDSGAKYITFVSRHHDGFSMWDTDCSDFDIVDATPYRRDIIKDLARECHRQGIRLHFYYSHLDWGRGDYPLSDNISDNNHLITGKDPIDGRWDNYYRFMNSQLT